LMESGGCPRSGMDEWSLQESLEHWFVLGDNACRSLPLRAADRKKRAATSPKTDRLGEVSRRAAILIFAQGTAVVSPPGNERISPRPPPPVHNISPASLPPFTQMPKPCPVASGGLSMDTVRTPSAGGTHGGGSSLRGSLPLRGDAARGPGPNSRSTSSGEMALRCRLPLPRGGEEGQGGGRAGEEPWCPGGRSPGRGGRLARWRRGGEGPRRAEDTSSASK
jgi:hypothetical protein